MCSCCFVPHPTSTSICLHSCVCACVFLLVPSGSVPSPSPLFWLYTWERLLGAALGPETWMKQTFISHESTVLPDLFYFVLSFVSLFFFEWPKSSCRESQSSFIPWSLLLWICSLWCTLNVLTALAAPYTMCLCTDVVRRYTCSLKRFLTKSGPLSDHCRQLYWFKLKLIWCVRDRWLKCSLLCLKVHLKHSGCKYPYYWSVSPSFTSPSFTSLSSGACQ